MSTSPTDYMRQRFEEKVARVIGVPVLFENANAYWHNGKRLTKLPADCEYFMRYAFKTAGTNQVDFGNVVAQSERTIGAILIQVNGPIGSGTKELEEFAETIRAAFRRITLNGVTYRTPSKSTPRRRGKWWALTVRCPVQFDESTAPSEA